jgi:hypothetical protein
MALPRDVANTGLRPKTIADEQEIGFLQFAWGHAMGRNNRVAKVFCYLSVMRSANFIPDKSKVFISPGSLPVPQDFNATGGNQAAHYLPGFVAIGIGNKKPRYLWDLVTDKMIRDEIADLFRATQDLPASYNKADSIAEARRRLGPPGLKQIFGECCQLTVDSPPLHSRMTNERLILVDRSLVAGVFYRWAQDSARAFAHASDKKIASIKVKQPSDVRSAPRTDLSTGALNEWTVEDLDARNRDMGRTVHGKTGTVQDFTDQESFLRAYSNATSSSFPLSEAVIRKIEAPFSAHKVAAAVVG